MAAAPKFINAPSNVPREAIEGLLYARPDLTVVPEAPNVIVRRDIPLGKTALICGGGSGHEPAHGGFVADGWLTALVCGGVFASPSHASVLAAIRHVAAANGNAGVLVVIKNYGGDVINFTYAATVASVEFNVATFVIGDDVAFGADHDAQRGVAGTVLLYKLLGAAAAEGASLTDLVQLASSLRRNLRSLGASMSSCAVPGMPRTSTIPSDVYELGLGIHGEAGKVRIAIEECDAIVERVIAQIGNPPAIDSITSQSLLPVAEPSTNWWSNESAAIGRVVLFVNNLGATTDIEMQIVLRAAVTSLKRRGVAVDRVVSTRSMTALDMHGISITVLALPDALLADRVLSLLDRANPSTVAFSAVAPAQAAPPRATKVNDATARLLARAAKDAPDAARVAAFCAVGLRVCSHLRTQEAELNAFDAVVGDGDIGSGAARACEAVSQLLNAVQGHAASAGGVPSFADVLAAVGETVADSFAGTSGPLLGAFLAAAAASITPEMTNVAALIAGLPAGSAAVRAVGGASIGDRTMVDALEPLAVAARSFTNETPSDLLETLTQRCREAADAAKQLRARKGRARYSNGREVGQAEPGCELVHRILAATQQALH